MAQHRKSTHRRRLGIVALAALGTALSGSLVLGPEVDAAITLKPKAKIVRPTNSDVLASCKFQATRATPSFVNYTLTANGFQKDFDGLRANVNTKVNCYVLPPGITDPNDAFISFTATADGFARLPRSTKGSVPYFLEYTLCGSAQVTKQNGDTTFTPYVCL